jgi:hypothetical protein
MLLKSIKSLVEIAALLPDLLAADLVGFLVAFLLAAGLRVAVARVEVRDLFADFFAAMCQ